MKMPKIEKWFINRPRRAEQVINRAEKLLRFVDVKEKQDFLEVGCGSGAVAKHLAKKYLLNVTGVDIDPEQIGLAQQSTTNIPNIRFLEVDATHLPFPDSGFDIVLSFGVMHHISNWLDALREVRRVLRPHGYFIYTDIIYPEWMANLGRLFQRRYGITTTRDLDAFIKKNGFSTIYTSPKNSLLMQHDFEAVYHSN